MPFFVRGLKSTNLKLSKVLKRRNLKLSKVVGFLAMPRTPEMRVVVGVWLLVLLMPCRGIAIAVCFHPQRRGFSVAHCLRCSNRKISVQKIIGDVPKPRPVRPAALSPGQSRHEVAASPWVSRSGDVAAPSGQLHNIGATPRNPTGVPTDKLK